MERQMYPRQILPKTLSKEYYHHQYNFTSRFKGTSLEITTTHRLGSNPIQAGPSVSLSDQMNKVRASPDTPFFYTIPGLTVSISITNLSDWTVKHYYSTQFSFSIYYF